MSVINTQPLIGASGNQATGYNIERSLRFRGASSTYLNKTLTTPTNRSIWTWSAWVKRGTLGTQQGLIGAGDGTSNASGIFFSATGYLGVYDYVGALFTTNFATTQVFRDPSAWYHIIVAYDTTQATSTNRVKIYVNGTQITSFTTASYPSQNYASGFMNSSTYVTSIGREDGFGNYFDGYMTDINFIDGQALTPSSFGETDTITGVWKAKRYTGTYGANGYYLPFNNNSTSSYVGSFNGSNQYLVAPSSSNLQLGSSDYTVEMWVYSTNYGSPVLYDGKTSAGTAIQMYFPSGVANIYGGAGTGTLLITGSSALPTNRWNHIALVRASNTTTLYINGVQSGSSVTDTTNYNAASAGATIGSLYGGSANYFSGYMSNFRIVKGTAVYTGAFTPPTAPLTAISGTQLLTLQDSTIIDNSANAFTLTNNGSITTSSQYPFSTNVFNDRSPQGNHWTPNNINVGTVGATYDSMTDVPTLTSATAANYCTINPLMSGGTISEANLKGVVNNQSVFGTTAMSTGKFYWECKIDSVGTDGWFGVVDAAINLSSYNSASWSGGSGFHYKQDGTKNNGTSTAYGASWTTGDILGCALDMSTGTITFYKNGTSQGVAFSSNVAGRILIPSFFATTTTTVTFNFGQRPFAYTIPSGYNAVNTYNLPDSTIVAGNKVMDATTWTANGTTQTVTNAGGFKPDFIWTKNRSINQNHYSVDTNLGLSQILKENTQAAASTDANFFTSANSNGFSLGSSNFGNGENIVAWQWQAGQGTNTSNTNGNVTSTVSVNASAGFSIVKYTVTSTASMTIGHGLGVAPKFIIEKRYDTGSTANWDVYHASAGNTGRLILNSTAAFDVQAGVWNNTSPTSTVFSQQGNGAWHSVGATCVAYCWAEVAGFSKFGSYTGNGSSDGPFIHLGFRPKFILVKAYSSTNVTSWNIYDSARGTYNLITADLYPNLGDAETADTYGQVDFLSNGFKLRPAATTYGINQSSGIFIYAAFAENPFKNSLAR